MTAPDLQADAAAETSAMTFEIIKDQLLGSVLTMLRLLGPAVAAIALVVLVVATALIARRARAEARAGAKTLDPRPLADPSAPDLLGEWA